MSPPVSTHRAARHRAARRRRLGALGGALVVTFLVGAAAVGVLPRLRATDATTTGGTSTLEQASLASLSQPVAAEIEAKDAAAGDLRKKAQEAADARASAKLPSNSGTGRRIVFSEGAQRVWLIDNAGKVQRTYLVSGSKFDNLQPGTYSVQSKTRNATAFDGSGTMEFFVRFATGYTAPIGFHTVPVDNYGRPEQTKSQLGTPQSAGCVRQWRDDAIALWNFAPIGTVVVVTT